MNRDQVERFRRTVKGPYVRPYEMPHPHWLYRAFDADGELLYIGCSLNPTARIDHHAITKVWWELVRTITLETFPTKAEARAAEAAAVKAERPLYNVTHNRPRFSGPTIPLHWDEAKHLLDDEAAS